MIDLADLDIQHHSCNGVYAKETRIKAGMVLAQHKHAYAHMSILASGSVILRVGSDERILRAPACVTIAAHEHHLVQALSDSVWFCIWPEDGDFLDPEQGDMQAMAQAMAKGKAP